MQRKLCLALVIPALVMGLVYAGDEDKAKDKETPKAPSFVLKDSAGKEHDMGKLDDKTVVLEWTNPSCPYVVRHYEKRTMKELAEKYAKKGVVWLAVNSTDTATADEMEKWRKKHALTYPILMDTDGTVGHQLHAKTTPHMFIVHKGEVVFRGAIDDDMAGSKEEPVNYVAQALDELLAGKEVSVSKCKSYGCSVKYAKSVN